jgi:hypothetical protein
VSHAKLASVFRKIGESTQALDTLRQRRAILVRLISLSPGNADWKNDLVWFGGQIAADLER